MLCLRCGRTNQKGPGIIHVLQAFRAAWCGFRQNILENIPKLCVLCSKKPQCLCSFPHPHFTKGSMLWWHREYGLRVQGAGWGRSTSEVQLFLACWLWDPGQVSVSSFVKRGKLFPLSESLEILTIVSIGRTRCHWWHMYLIGPLWFSVLYILLFPCLCSWTIKKQKNLL